MAGSYQSGEGVRRDTSPSALGPLVSIVKERPASVLRDGLPLSSAALATLERTHERPAPHWPATPRRAAHSHAPQLRS
jgi:hypothetical protein